MGKKFTPADLELYQRTDEVLHYIWDPVGVSGVPMARDEYQGYVPQIIGLLKEGAAAEKIAAYLDSVATERMGLNANPKHANEVANVLLDWNEFVAEKHR